MKSRETKFCFRFYGLSRKFDENEIIASISTAAALSLNKRSHGLVSVPCKPGHRDGSLVRFAIFMLELPVPVRSRNGLQIVRGVGHVVPSATVADFKDDAVDA